MSETLLPRGGSTDLPQPKAKKPKRPRISVLEQVAYSAPGESPDGTSIRYSYAVESDEQPWERSFKVAGEWQPLDLGWLKPPCLVVLENRGKVPVYLSFEMVTAHLRIQPGRSTRLDLFAPARVIALGGESLCKVYAYPE